MQKIMIIIKNKLLHSSQLLKELMKRLLVRVNIANQYCKPIHQIVDKAIYGWACYICFITVSK